MTAIPKKTLAGVLNDGQQYLLCPYDPSHIILTTRMATHLIKCAKNHLDSELVQCHFDSTHLVPKPELTYHEKTCSKRALVFDPFIYKTGENVEVDVMPVNKAAENLPEPEENWDADACFGSVLEFQRKICEDKPVLRVLEGANPSQRRAFRATERLRLNKLANGNMTDLPSLSNQPCMSAANLPPRMNAASQPTAKVAAPPIAEVVRGALSRQFQPPRPIDSCSIASSSSRTNVSVSSIADRFGTMSVNEKANFPAAERLGAAMVPNQAAPRSGLPHPPQDRPRFLVNADGFCETPIPKPRGRGILRPSE